MRTDTLLQATADAFGWSYDELYALKYELDQHTYYYGEHFRNPRETSTATISPEQFAQNVAGIKQIEGLLANNPTWIDLSATDNNPTVVAFNYNYGNWTAPLKQAGYNIEQPLWHCSETDNGVQQILQAACSLLKGMLFSDFKLLLSEEFRDSDRIVRNILASYYKNDRFKAVFVPYSLSFFEYITVNIFKSFGKPTFVFEHGVPSAYVPELLAIPDYTVVWGEQEKLNYVKAGVAPEKILVAGHPSYQSYTPGPLKFGIDDVLVCTWIMGGAPEGNMAHNQNRGHSTFYLYSIQSVLEKMGIRHVRLRPHPSESGEWYRRFVDTGFFQLDQAPLMESLQRSSLVIGPATTVVLEAVYYGVNYLLFHPEEFNIEDFYHKEWPPFSGEDKRIPVAHNKVELEKFIRDRVSIDSTCFSDYIKTPFDPELVIQTINYKQPIISQNVSNIEHTGYSLMEYNLQKVSDNTKKIIDFVKPYTMTPPQRIVNVVKSIDYVLDNGIQGAFVECGVWRGGCSMAAACELLIRDASNRDLFLYDTYEGMSPPTGHDVALETGVSADALLSAQARDKENHIWAYAPFGDVVANLTRTSYPRNRMHFVKGKVEDTIPGTIPDSIAVLRLDTDWYESTRHELIHLYPRLVRGGVLIIDDYGCWAGSRKAVDEFLTGLACRPELVKIEDDLGSTAYYCIKS